MKKIIFTFLLAILNLSMYAQTSDSFSYQAIVRNSSGAEVVSQPVSFRFNIIKGGASGLSVYSEKHAKTTNQFGLVTLSIGNGTNKIGNLSSIDWGADIYFLKVELDATGGVTYLDMGTTQLMSVPYALHAKVADNGFSGSYLDLTNKPAGNNAGDMQYWDGANWVVLPRGNNGQIITMNSSNIPTWQNASAILLAPTSTTQPATNVQLYAATINGIVNANGLSTTVVFEWGLTSSYGNTLIASQSPVTGNTNVTVSENITGLLSNTTYHYRIACTNAVNITRSNDISFTTQSLSTLTTSTITSITSNSAISGGNISSDGGFSIIAKGVCWSTSANPTTSDSKTNEGTGTGTFTSNIFGLTLGTLYHIRAYATTSLGTSYGADVSFTTLNLPSVNTSSISALSTTTATFGGKINSDGDATITAKGVCWSIGQNPTILDDHTIDGAGNGDFTSNLTGLTLNTTYYVRAYALNSVGYAYGDEISFKTLNINQIVDIDVNVYNTTTIGTQVWMKENLKVTRYINGDAIDYGYGSTTSAQYCWWKSSIIYKNQMGALYNYYCVEDARNLCPTGWHVPTDTEWSTLETYLGGISVAGGKLKEVGTTHWISPNTGADNSSDFTAIPAGYWKGENFSSFWGGGRDTAFLWSATAATYNAWSRLIKNNTINTIRSERGKDWSFSVRCVKD